jgi:hypothetical protein
LSRAPTGRRGPRSNGAFTPPPEERVPPQNLGAERQVLGGMLVSPETIPRAVEIVGERAFQDPRNRLVYGAIYRLWERAEPIDAVSVGAMLQQTGDVDAAGGASYLAELMEGVAKPDEDRVAYHARLVRDAAVLRDIIEATTRAAERAAQGNHEPAGLIGSLIGDLEPLVQKVRQGSLIGPGISLRDLKAKNPQLPPYLVHGVLFHGSPGKSGNTALLSGPPGVSKTWAMFQLAKAVAEGSEWFGLPTAQARIAIFELEMSEAEIEPRCQALDALGGDGWREHVVLFSKDQIPGGQLDLCDPGVLMTVVRLVKSLDVKLVVFDNLSHLHYLNENSSGEASRIMAALDRVSAQTGCAILVLHHDRKSLEGGSSKQTRDSVRGSTVIQARPGAVLGLSINKGLRYLQFHKVRGTRAPDPVYLEEAADGHLEPTEAPEDQKRVRVMRLNVVESVLTETPESIPVIQDRLATLRHAAVQPRLLRDDLNDLVAAGRAVKEGGGHGKRVAYRRPFEEEM